MLIEQCVGFGKEIVAARLRIVHRRLDRRQLFLGERGVVFDGQVVASVLEDDIENFLKWHGGICVLGLEGNRNHGQLVTEVAVTRSLYSNFCKAIAELGRQNWCNSISTNQQVANVVKI